jgi:hypothetical protein
MRTDRIAKSLIAALLLGALVAASVAVNVAPANASAPPYQRTQKSQPKFRRVRVTAADIARLPRGKNFVVQISAETRGRAGGYTGSTPVTGGVLNSTDKGGNSGLTKAGAGTPVLSGNNNNNVYEFHSDRPIDFSRVMVQAGANAAPVPLESWLRKHRPASGMRGWPFKRLLIGPAEGIAEIEGWKIKDTTPPGTEFKCESGGKDIGGDIGDDYCGCSSYLDCALLVLAGKCSSELSCGDGECYCDAG